MQAVEGGTAANDYAASIESRRSGEGHGPFRGTYLPTPSANFDLSGEPITSYDQGGGGGSYTARNGDRLASVAVQLWGDSSLWYKLAEANGLSGDTALVEGQRIAVPPGIVRSGHNASTLKPYDPSEAMGDLSPAATARRLPRYKLAEANGMSAANGLVEGQNLTIARHHAQHPQRFDLPALRPTEAMGDTSPTATNSARPPKRDKCGCSGRCCSLRWRWR